MTTSPRRSAWERTGLFVAFVALTVPACGDKAPPPRFPDPPPPPLAHPIGEPVQPGGADAVVPDRPQGNAKPDAAPARSNLPPTARPVARETEESALPEAGSTGGAGSGTFEPR